MGSTSITTTASIVDQVGRKHTGQLRPPAADTVEEQVLATTVRGQSHRRLPSGCGRPCVPRRYPHRKPYLLPLFP